MKEDPLRQAKYVLVESKKGSRDIQANLLKLGPEINEGRKAKIYFIEKHTKQRVYVWEENPYHRMSRETKEGMVRLLNHNAIELGEELENIREGTRCDAIAAMRKKSG